MPKDSKKKQKTPPAVGPNDVALHFLDNLAKLFREAQNNRAIVARLEEYRRLHPDRWQHVAAFLRGHDEPNTEQMHEATSRALEQST